MHAALRRAQRDICQAVAKATGWNLFSPNVEGLDASSFPMVRLRGVSRARAGVSHQTVKLAFTGSPTTLWLGGGWIKNGATFGSLVSASADVRPRIARQVPTPLFGGQPWRTHKSCGASARREPPD